MKILIKILITFSIIFAACSTPSIISDKNFSEPVIKNQPNLIYPVSAQKNNHYGTAQILFNISKEGKVTETLVKESSGYEDLDKTAENYCKGLLFIPAKINGNPTEYGMRLDIKFDLKDLKNNTINKIDNIIALYDNEKKASGIQKLIVQTEILDHHSFVINDINDCEKFNEYVYSAISPSLTKEWKTIAKSCPLSFLLFHDFIIRYGNYENIDTVKSLLEYSLIQDLNNLEINENRDVIMNKSEIVKMIVKFAEKNYPNINLDFLDLSKRSKNTDIS